MTDQFNLGERPNRVGVARRGYPDSWAVLAGGTGADVAEVLNRDGEWEIEPRTSDRDEAFIARTRFPLDEAMSRAQCLLDNAGQVEA